jgi:hypothetical protein
VLTHQLLVAGQAHVFMSYSHSHLGPWHCVK